MNGSGFEDDAPMLYGQRNLCVKEEILIAAFSIVQERSGLLKFKAPKTTVTRGKARAIITVSDTINNCPFYRH